MRYMLDTNICIYLIRRQPPQVLRRLEALNEGDVCMSVITYAELRAGLEIQSEQCEHDQRVLAQLVQRIPVLPLDEAGAESYGRLRAAVRDRRRDALDRLIAAQAVAAGSILITNNEADFADYPDLQVENWVKD